MSLLQMGQVLAKFTDQDYIDVGENIVEGKEVKRHRHIKEILC